MSVRFDHTLVAAHDKHKSAQFFAEIFGLPEPAAAGFFVMVRLADGVELLFAELGIDFPGQHYAFLVEDAVFDAILERIKERGITYWADPQMRYPGQINTNHGGRGVYNQQVTNHIARQSRSTPTMAGAAYTLMTLPGIILRR